jgi:hypothetical protein
MAYYGSVKISDRDGWLKNYPLEKALLMVGSGTMNDIVLSDERGSGVASLHIQVFRPQAEQNTVRVVNLAKSGLPFRRSRGENGSLLPGSSIMLGSGDAISLGEYSLQFTLQAQPGVVRTARSAHLGLKLELPGLDLTAGGRLAGQLTVTNYGDQGRCQFELELEGLSAGCYQIDPAPLLFPRAEEHLQIRFFHRGSRPLAGKQAFTLRATAPAAYPAEMVAISETLDVSPVYRVELAVEDPTARVEAPAPAPMALEALRPGPQPVEIPPVVASLAAPAVSPPLAFEEPAPVSSQEGVTPEVTPAPEPDWYPADSSAGPAQPVRVTSARLAGGRRPVLSRTGQAIPVIKSRPEPEPEANPPAEEGKTP